MIKYFNRFNKLMRPNDNLWLADAIFVLVPFLMLSPLFYGLLVPQQSTYEYAGPGFVDGSFGWVDVILGFAGLLFLVVLFVTSVNRLLYRTRHRKSD